MATITLNIEAKIHAEIISTTYSLSDFPIIIDPLTNSYSDFGKLIRYNLTVNDQTENITNAEILQNGKNSRLIVSGSGTVTIGLEVEDEFGNTDTDEVTITID